MWLLRMLELAAGPPAPALHRNQPGTKAGALNLCYTNLYVGADKDFVLSTVRGVIAIPSVGFAHRQLSSMSEGLGQRMDQVLQVQQKANRVLIHVLGAQYTPCEHFTLKSVTRVPQPAVLQFAIDCQNSMQCDDGVLFWLVILICRRDGDILSHSCTVDTRKWMHTEEQVNPFS